MIKNKNCIVCNKEYFVYPNRANITKFCSHLCQGIWSNKFKSGKDCQNWKGGKKEFICLICRNKFLSWENRKFCSRKCMGKWFSKERRSENSHLWKGGEVEKYCKICNKKFHVPPSEFNRDRGGKNKGKFCSKKCYGKWLSVNYIKEKNPYWKNGISTLYQLIKSLKEYHLWRLEIFKRDRFTCRICQQRKDGKLRSHHIIPFGKILKDFISQYPQFSLIEDKEIFTRLAITYMPFWDISNGITLCLDCHKLEHYGGRLKKTKRRNKAQCLKNF